MTTLASPTPRSVRPTASPGRDLLRVASVGTVLVGFIAVAAFTSPAVALLLLGSAAFCLVVVLAVLIERTSEVEVLHAEVRRLQAALAHAQADEPSLIDPITLDLEADRPDWAPAPTSQLPG